MANNGVSIVDNFEGEENPPANKYPNRFKKGTSGNYLGRPKVDKEGRELARLYSTAATNWLMEVAGNPRASLNTRMRAAASLLSIAWNKRKKFKDLGVMEIQEYMRLLRYQYMGVPYPQAEILARSKNQREANELAEAHAAAAKREKLLEEKRAAHGEKWVVKEIAAHQQEVLAQHKRSLAKKEKLTPTAKTLVVDADLIGL